MSAASRITTCVRLNLRVQQRSGFIQILLGLALVLVVVVRLGLPETLWPLLVPTMLLVEYGAVGLTLVAAMQYLESNEKSAAALAVSPLESTEHVAAMLLAPALVGTVAGLGIQAGLIGLDARVLLLLPPLLVTCVLAGAAGLWVACYYREFTRFILGVIPIVALIQLPLLSLYGLTPRFTWLWHPADAALYSFTNLTEASPSLLAWAGYLALLVGFCTLGFRQVHRVYCERILQRLGEST
ncbi:MAG: hypothetical protein JRG92_04565 [Deltaproteobacteria bacterium]|nr:hypothetical protein [Deltaproteobacteria bacterium]MBW2697108.1 hypothetical protein [Deltaproteobacteria bacterium]